QASDWVGVLALGGLEWGPPGAPIVVHADGPTWVVTVSDHGSRRTASLPAPASANDREDLVWLVVSLLAPVDIPDSPPVPEPPTPVPASVATHRPPPEPAPVPGLGGAAPGSAVRPPDAVQPRVAVQPVEPAPPLPDP